MHNCTMSFDTHGSTMMGVKASEFIDFERELPQRLAACGSNCGVGAAQVVAGMLNMARVADPGMVLVAKGNCGVPKFVDGAIRYDGTPELMAVYVRLALDAGARIVGGCCGTTPEHLRDAQRARSAHAGGAADDGTSAGATRRGFARRACVVGRHGRPRRAAGAWRARCAVRSPALAGRTTPFGRRLSKPFLAAFLNLSKGRWHGIVLRQAQDERYC
jgi:Homocysteine S-methyltransferase